MGDVFQFRVAVSGVLTDSPSVQAFQSTRREVAVKFNRAKEH